MSATIWKMRAWGRLKRGKQHERAEALDGVLASPDRDMHRVVAREEGRGLHEEVLTDPGGAVLVERDVAARVGHEVGGQQVLRGVIPVDAFDGGVVGIQVKREPCRRRPPRSVRR